MAQNQTNTPPSLPSLLLLSPPPPLPFGYRQNVAPFRPSIAVIVAVLTTMFSITFLLLLYAKHCKRGHGRGSNSAAQTSLIAGRNSGIDRAVVESLPVFRFASLRGQKQGLECSVCLNKFEPNEVLRLLPKCKHVFHVECVDTWLDAHSTCPLCRYRVDLEDILLLELEKEEQGGGAAVHSHLPVRLSTAFENRDSDELTRIISWRHSSAGERRSSFVQILVQRPDESTQSESLRRSVDSVYYSRKRGESVGVGCFDRGGVRKDGLLLSETAKAEDRENFLRRFEHRIILSTEGGAHRRWSDLRPLDLLVLQSEMIISNSGRYSLSSYRQKRAEKEVESRVTAEQEEEDRNGTSIINTTSVSEITGLHRFASETGQGGSRFSC